MNHFLFFFLRQKDTQSFSALQDSTALWELHCSPGLLPGEKNQTCVHKCEWVIKHQNSFLKHLEVKGSVSMRFSLGEHEGNAERRPQNQQVDFSRSDTRFRAAQFCKEDSAAAETFMTITVPEITSWILLLAAWRWFHNQNKLFHVVPLSLNATVRCSSEELLDRLFKKSVVTEAEVISLSHLKAQSWFPLHFPFGIREMSLNQW